MPEARGIPPQLLLVFAVILSTPTLAKSSENCRWDGTAPFCGGECGPGWEEDYRTAVVWQPSAAPEPAKFGAACTWGEKSYCCKTPANCKWDGTAPFCDGECRSGWHKVEECDSCSGNDCWTGTKVKCCKEKTGSTASSATASLHARFAVIWKKAPFSLRIVAHALTSKEYQAQFEQLGKAGMSILQVNGYPVGDKIYFSAIWYVNLEYSVIGRHNLTAAQYLAEFNTLKNQGYRLRHVSGYATSGTPLFAAVWDNSPGPEVLTQIDRSVESQQTAFETLPAKGFRLIHISGYSVSGAHRYATVWERGSNAAMFSHHRMTIGELQSTINNYGALGYGLVDLSAYALNGTAYFAAIWRPLPPGNWSARLGVLGEDFQKSNTDSIAEEYQIESMSGYFSY